MALAVIRFSGDTDDDVIEEFAGKVEAGIKAYLVRNTKKGSGVLAESIRSYVYGKEIVVESDAPHAKVMDKGSQGKVMWSLINKVVPIKLGDGRTIFRRVTMESIARGKWRQGPRAGLEFVRRGIDLAKSGMSLRAAASFVVEQR
jgi:hypothetical protein